MSNYMVTVNYGDECSIIYSFKNKSKTAVMAFCERIFGLDEWTMLKEADFQRHVANMCKSYQLTGLTMIRVNGFPEADDVIVNEAFTKKGE